MQQKRGGGKEVEFDESAVLEAGLRALQKEGTADKRLEEATKAREEAERLRVSVEATLAKVQQPAQPSAIGEVLLHLCLQHPNGIRLGPQLQHEIRTEREEFFHFLLR